jgi:hypothetical protein
MAAGKGEEHQPRQEPELLQIVSSEVDMHDVAPRPCRACWAR